MVRAPWSEEPDTVADVPTMLSTEECRYLHWLLRTQWQDRGHVVEIGPWLGGSTRCMAEGMRAGRPSAAHRLHVYDNFVWRAFMQRFAPLPLAPGDSFEPTFRAHLAGHEERIVVHRRSLPDETIPGDVEAEGIRGREAPDLPRFEWDAREPIEILFVDGAKSWRGMRWLLRCTAPALRAGHTLLVCQDFKYWGAYWVPLLLAGFRDRLELLHSTRRGSTVTFRLAGALDAARLEALVDDATRLPIGPALDGLESMARALDAHGDRVGAMHVRLSGVQFLLHQRRAADALALFEHLQQRWPLRGPKGQLHDARRRLAELGLAAPAWSTWKRLCRVAVLQGAPDLAAFGG